MVTLLERLLIFAGLQLPQHVAEIVAHFGMAPLCVPRVSAISCSSIMTPR